MGTIGVSCSRPSCHKGWCTDMDGYHVHGWKIRVRKGDQIVTHAGQAFGQASSFRAEGHGVLSQ
eukprot:1249165-Ditylum_brightwellii.AAC.1